MFKANNKDTRTTPGEHINFEHVSHRTLVFLLLALNMWLPVGFITKTQVIDILYKQKESRQSHCVYVNDLITKDRPWFTNFLLHKPNLQQVMHSANELAVILIERSNCSVICLMSNLQENLESIFTYCKLWFTCSIDICNLVLTMKQETMSKIIWAGNSQHSLQGLWQLVFKLSPQAGS